MSMKILPKKYKKYFVFKIISIFAQSKIHCGKMTHNPKFKGTILTWSLANAQKTRMVLFEFSVVQYINAMSSLCAFRGEIFDESMARFTIKAPTKGVALMLPIFLN